MTAITAAGDPLPPFYIRASLASIPEDDEAWVFQDPLPRFIKISHPTWYGTYPAVAISVEKFPFRPRDNCRHEPHRSAAAAMTPPRISTSAAGHPLPPFYVRAHLASIPEDDEAWVFPDSSPRFPVRSLDNRRHEPHRSATATPPKRPPVLTPFCIPNTDVNQTLTQFDIDVDDIIRRIMEKLFPTISLPTTTPMPQHPTTPPQQPTLLSPTPSKNPNETPLRKPVGLDTPNHHLDKNMCNPQPSPLAPLPTMTMTRQTLAQPKHPVFPLNMPTSLHKREYIDIDIPYPQTHPLLPSASLRTTKPQTTMTIQQATPSPHQSTHHPTPPSSSLVTPDLSPVPPDTPATSLPLPYLSLTARMLHNNVPTNNTLWRPAALTRRRTLHQPTQRPCTTHPVEQATGNSPSWVTMLHGANNSPDDNPATCNHFPAVDTHFATCHKFPASHTPTLHPAQCRHHYPVLLCNSLAINWKVLAHNLRPP